jgi:hypothetical protein
MEFYAKLPQTSHRKHLRADDQRENPRQETVKETVAELQITVR